MNRDRLLALHHYSALYHSGQWSRLYRIGCRVSKKLDLTREEEYPQILSKPGYERARELFLGYVRSDIDDSSGAYDCNGDNCGEVVMCMESESGIILCDECKEA